MWDPTQACKRTSSARIGRVSFSASFAAERRAPPDLRHRAVTAVNSFYPDKTGQNRHLPLGLGCIYAPSVCFPIGAVILYGCLNERTRKSFIG